MPEWSDPDRRRELERRLAQCAADVLVGRCTLIGTTQEMRSLVTMLDLADDDSICRDLCIIASETDCYPLGAERQYWADEALARLQPEIERAEAWAREFGLETCRLVIERYGSPRRSSEP